MATVPISEGRRRTARTPFHFNTSAHVLQIGRERASSLGELLENLRSCPEASIFQHTFRTLDEHHFIREGFSNDFAHWAFASCNEPALAERLASVDIREFTSIGALRETIVKIVAEYLNNSPRSADRAGLEPFYFCASVSEEIPTTLEASNLEEFADGLEKVSVHSIHYHFIEARLRLRLNSNDFSVWLKAEMDMPEFADEVNSIDIYTSTLEDVRKRIAAIVRSAGVDAA